MLSEHLMVNMIRFEREINSKTAHYISEWIESNTLTPNERNNVKQKIKSAKRCINYDLGQTWTYIPKMTFSELVHLLIWLKDNKRDVYSKIVLDYDFLNKDTKKRLHELNHLRNTIFHGRPINVYLVYGRVNGLDLYQKNRKRIIKWLFNLRHSEELKGYFQEMLQHAIEFLNIKKQSTHKH